MLGSFWRWNFSFVVDVLRGRKNALAIQSLINKFCNFYATGEGWMIHFENPFSSLSLLFHISEEARFRPSKDPEVSRNLEALVKRLPFSCPLQRPSNNILEETWIIQKERYPPPPPFLPSLIHPDSNSDSINSGPADEGPLLRFARAQMNLWILITANRESL